MVGTLTLKCLTFIFPRRREIEIEMVLIVASDILAIRADRHDIIDEWMVSNSTCQESLPVNYLKQTNITVFDPKIGLYLFENRKSLQLAQLVNDRFNGCFV